MNKQTFIFIDIDSWNISENLSLMVGVLIIVKHCRFDFKIPYDIIYV